MSAFFLGEYMKLFTIDSNYIDYLKQFDKNVMNHFGDKYNKTRKYIGILLEVNGFKYLAPLSSPKKTDYLEDGKIRNSIVSLIRIVYENRLLGTIKLSNMIPVFNEKVIEYYVLEKETDLKYKDLVFNELKFIYQNKELIIKNANKLYKQKLLNLDIGYIKNTINFKLLEEKAKEYKA